MWRRRVRAALTELAHDLRDHVALTEADGALYSDISATAPRLTHGVELQLRLVELQLAALLPNAGVLLQPVAVEAVEYGNGGYHAVVQA